MAPYHYHSSTKCYIWHNAVWQVTFSRYQSNPDSPIRLPNRTRSHCSRVQWQCALHHSIWYLPLYLAIFAMILMSVDVWNSSAMELAQWWQLLCIMHLSTHYLYTVFHFLWKYHKLRHFNLELNSLFKMIIRQPSTDTSATESPLASKCFSLLARLILNIKHSFLNIWKYT